jgi:ATP-binding cassette, subfamily C, bacterial LapB
LGPVQTVFTNLPRIERVRSAVRQLDALMKIKGEQIEVSAPSVARGARGAVEFNRVSFRYGINVDPALIGVSFTVKPGELIAITGANGGGKSTLLKLILGMYQPQAGSIRFDGTDIRQIDPADLRRLMGYAPQDVQFFRATIMQNLRLARPDATERQIFEALDMAGARKQVMALPKGLDFRVGDNASDQIPSGLRQKLSLARAYLTGAPVLLFDEPGTGLDNEGDEAFMETLRALRGRATVFYITHRPSHMRLADLLLVMEGGYLRNAGTPDELLKQPGVAA